MSPLLLTVLWLLLGACATVLVAGLCAFDSGTDDDACCGYGEPCAGE
jgi:hypothetical protein